MPKCSRHATSGENSTQKLDFPWIPTAPPPGQVWYYTQAPLDKSESKSPAKTLEPRDPSPITPTRYTNTILSNTHHL